MTARQWARVLLLGVVCLAGPITFAKADTPTTTPTRTPTGTPTNTPVIAGGGGAPLIGRAGARRIDRMNNYAPAAREADLADVAMNGVRQRRLKATNATSLGFSDVRLVTSILAFTATTGAPATKTLLEEGADYTVANGDVTPVSDHSSEVWVITYRP